MIDAITQCPACRTSFRVNEAQLRVADGTVRCGACLHIFQAEDYLLSPLLDVTEQLAIEQDYWQDFATYIEQVGQPAQSEPVEMFTEVEVQTSTQSESETGTESETDEVDVVETDDDLMTDYLAYLASHPGVEPSARYEKPSAGFEEQEQQEQQEEQEEQEELSSVFDEAESSEQVSDEGELPPELETLAEPFDFEFEHDPDQLLQDKRRLFPVASLKWLPGIAAMLAFLAIQWVFLNLDTFSQDERYRERLETICRVVGCSVPEYDNLQAMRTRELIIRSHPEVANALMVDVLLRNSADFRQRFPGLRLQFLDVRGNVVASRVFRADEYLGGEMRGLRYIPALTEVRLSLEIADPGENALGYQMEVVRI